MGQVQEFIIARRTRRNPRKLAWLTSDMIMAYDLLVIEENILTTYREAEISSGLEIWKNVILEEINSLHKSDTRELSKLHKGKKVIACKQVFGKKQRSQDGETVCYKARLVD